jgi:hypothetical protein
VTHLENKWILTKGNNNGVTVKKKDELGLAVYTTREWKKDEIFDLCYCSAGIDKELTGDWYDFIAQYEQYYYALLDDKQGDGSSYNSLIKSYFLYGIVAMCNASCDVHAAAVRFTLNEPLVLTQDVDKDTELTFAYTSVNTREPLCSKRMSAMYDRLKWTCIEGKHRFKKITALLKSDVSESKLLALLPSENERTWMYETLKTDDFQLNATVINRNDIIDLLDNIRFKELREQLTAENVDELLPNNQLKTWFLSKLGPNNAFTFIRVEEKKEEKAFLNDYASTYHSIMDADSKVEVRSAGVKGNGLFAKEEINQGTKLTFYAGATNGNRNSAYLKHMPDYLIDGNPEFLKQLPEPIQKKALGSYANSHSGYGLPTRDETAIRNETNATFRSMQYEVPTDIDMVWLEATKPIKKDDEIIIDYGVDYNKEIDEREQKPVVLWYPKSPEEIHRILLPPYSIVFKKFSDTYAADDLKHIKEAYAQCNVFNRNDLISRFENQQNETLAYIVNREMKREAGRYDVLLCDIIGKEPLRLPPLKVTPSLEIQKFIEAHCDLWQYNTGHVRALYVKDAPQGGYHQDAATRNYRVQTKYLTLITNIGTAQKEQMTVFLLKRDDKPDDTGICTVNDINVETDVERAKNNEQMKQAKKIQLALKENSHW